MFEIREEFTAHAVVSMCSIPQSQNELRGFAAWPWFAKEQRSFRQILTAIPPLYIGAVLILVFVWSR
jgi:hypothetical protein